MIVARRKITDRDLRTIEAEYAKWREVCNVKIGAVSFALGVACLGTPRPGIGAWMSIFFVLVLLHNFRQYFPQKIRELRAQELKGVDEFILSGIERNYFGLRAALMGFGGYFMLIDLSHQCSHGRIDTVWSLECSFVLNIWSVASIDDCKSTMNAFMALDKR